MRALRLLDFGTVAPVEVPDPVLGPDDAILQVLATGICGSDIHGYTGENGRRVPGQVMGHESVGRVVAIGANVDPTQVQIGRIATFNPVILEADRMKQFEGREQHDPQRRVVGVDPSIGAAFAELISIPARNVVLLPDSMPVAYGALIEPLAVALNAVRRVEVAPGDSVLVVGGGPIGQSAILAAVYEGAASVFVSELDSARRALCETLGATAIDPQVGAVPDQLVSVHGGLVDVAIDAVGVSSTLADSLNSTIFGGRVGLVGMGQPEIILPAYRVSTEERSIVGSFTYSFSIFEEVAAWVGGADPVFGTLISGEISLDEAQGTFERLARDQDVPGKILIRLAV